MSIFSLLTRTHTQSELVIDTETDRKQAESLSEKSECFLISCDGYSVLSLLLHDRHVHYWALRQEIN